MSVFKELFQAAETVGMKEQTSDQTDNDFLISLVKAISILPDEVWQRLSVPAQLWFDSAAKLANVMQPVPLCPGYIGVNAVEKLTTTVIPPKGLTAAEVFTSPASRFQAQTTAPPKEKKKSTGIMDAVRRTVVTHPEWTSRQVYDYLKLNGYPNAKLDSISVDGGNIRRVIDLIKELGYWKDKDEKPKLEEGKQIVNIAS